MNQTDMVKSSQEQTSVQPLPDPSDTITMIPNTFSADSPLVDLVLKTLSDDKAQDMVAIDLSGKTSLADVMVIANGRSHRHVSALADHLQRALKANGFGRCRVEGLPNCDWVLIDAGDVIIHIFRPEVREFYKIEKLWGENRASEQLVG